MNELTAIASNTPADQSLATSAEYTRLSEIVQDKNISPQTLLATDYLNHFNEIVMLIEMVPDMPEILEDAKEWQPKSYAEHFRDSSFSDKELAIEAYEHSPAEYRGPFDANTQRMNHLVELAIAKIETQLSEGDEEAAFITARAASRGLQKLIDVSSAIIHGSDQVLEQEAIDDLLLA